MNRIHTVIMDVLETYTPILGAVPLKLLHYHCCNHPKYGDNYTINEIEQQVENLKELDYVDVTRAYKPGR